MSSALLRQSLELVDSEAGGSRKKKQKRDVTRSSGQVERKQPYKKSKKTGKVDLSSLDNKLEQNLKRLQALSTPTLDKNITEKIVERAVKGRALADHIEVVKEEDKPILFTEESFKQFEKELFCS